MNPTNPISIIKSDHDLVKSEFDAYKSYNNYEDKKKEAEKICENLAIHMDMEEQYFYPEISDVSDEGNDLTDEAMKEHNEVKMHIKEAGMAEDEAELDKHVTMMEKEVLHHVEEEETKIFSFAEENLKDGFGKLAAEMMGYKTKAKAEELINDIKEKF